MKHSDICRKAASIIRKGGLCKGSYSNRNGEHCAIGSVVRAIGLDPYGMEPDPCSAFDRVVSDTQDERVLTSWVNDVLDHLRGMLEGRSVAVWNDQPATTADDVVQFLERAAVDFEGFEAEAPCNA